MGDEEVADRRLEDKTELVDMGLTDTGVQILEDRADPRELRAVASMF